jgi:putative ABC transport system permease protein
MRVMVALEVAVGVILLVGAGLLVASLIRLESIDPGFKHDGVSVASFTLGSAPGSPYTQPQGRARFYDQLLERTATIPGLAATGVTSSFPFGFSPNAGLEEQGVPALPSANDPETHYRVIGGRYFEALSVPLRQGRLFTPADTPGTPHVAIVNKATARLLWNGASPIGRRVRIPSVDRVQEFATIVGVVANMKHRGLAAPVVSEIYFPYQQRPFRTFTMTLVARSDNNRAPLGATLRDIVKEIDPAVPVQATPLSARLDTQLGGARFRTGLFAGFAVTALALAAFGIFGVVSYTVAARTREMGIRLALGAGAKQVRRLVLRRAMAPVLVGLAVGITVASFASRLLADMLFGVQRSDPFAYAGAALLLLAVAAAGAWWPAHRATRVDPLSTLRAQ